MSEHVPHSSRSSVTLYRAEPPARLDVRLWQDLPRSGCDVVALDGDLDAATTSAVRPALLAWLATTPAPYLHVDLDAIDFIGASGLSLLIELYEKGNIDRQLGFQRPSQRVARIVDLCGLAMLLDNRAGCGGARPRGHSAGADGGADPPSDDDRLTWPPPPVENSPLVVLSHRLPFVLDPVEGWERAPGGHACVLAPSPLGGDVVWFGHGSPSESVTDADVEGVRLVSLALSVGESRDVIDGFCNRTLWPALHGLGANIEHDPVWWDAYQKHSRATARTVAERSRHGAKLWIHDYHHFGVARELRGLRPDLGIGLFCHTPIDPDGLASLRPCRDIAQLLGAHHFIGTQTHADAVALEHVLTEHEIDPLPAIAVVPAGIDTSRWEGYRADAEIAAAAAIHAAPAGHLAVGIDRADYTKGIPHRLLAIEMLLDTGTLDPDEFRLVQIAPPSRTSIPIYAFVGNLIADIAHRINSRFVRTDAIPVIEVITDRQTPTQIAGYMRAADSAVVTPTREGMGLVAIEFSVLNADRPTDLILGRGAGVVDHLGPWADLVDPGDVLALAAAIRDVVRHPRVDRFQRSQARGRVAGQLSADRWTRAFLRRLHDATQPSGDSQASVAPSDTAPTMAHDWVDRDGSIQVTDRSPSGNRHRR